MSTLFSLMLVGLSLGQTPQLVQPFPDVPKTHWAYTAVTELHEKGILKGYPSAYDRSTPQAALFSLIKALDNDNEAMVRELTTARWQGIWMNPKYLSPASGKRMVELKQVLSYKLWVYQAEAVSHSGMDPKQEWEKFNAEAAKAPLGTEVEMRRNFGSHDFLFHFVQDSRGWKVSFIHSTEF